MKQRLQLGLEHLPRVEDVSNLMHRLRSVENNCSPHPNMHCHYNLNMLFSVPEIESNSPLQSLLPELSDYRRHMLSLLQSWEKDNQLVYFNKVSNIQSH